MQKNSEVLEFNRNGENSSDSSLILSEATTNGVTLMMMLGSRLKSYHFEASEEFSEQLDKL